MIKAKNLIILLVLTSCVAGCGIYNFTGGDVGTAKTFQVNYFQNYASQNPGSTFEPGMDRDFTLALQDLILNQTSLDLVKSNGDLLYEGEIVEYRISPMSATSQQTAAQNRLSIGVNVRFFNNTKEDVDFEQRFSFFYDYPANSQLASVKDEAHQVIFERITQDIFNKSLADW
ncbi:LptE family protein [Arenibacter sp. M-2]|uniref:LptE family protein n=1 Tax=unclassified Arenibacter TaxID=2615047 RepID=UPI000D75F5DD|nr:MULTISPECIES: LptE family protein [unclassified Arenibacter]MDL5510845.1 LptE family protein [Arenibacter sp. M-2]PXX31732.1 lipopolysaccharide assembly protein [Arenibacter sp. ARW7G5Y1]|tara:strand:+ start:4278 stop:4796 length:519 start_codon:yes stop_codon:yes gene_type:complete